MPTISTHWQLAFPYTPDHLAVDTSLITTINPFTTPTDQF